MKPSSDPVANRSVWWYEVTAEIQDVCCSLCCADLWAFFTIKIGFFFAILQTANELSFDPVKKCSSFIKVTQSIESLFLNLIQ